MQTSTKIFGVIFSISFVLNCILPIFPVYTGGMMYHVLGISLLPIFILPFIFKVSVNDFLSMLILFFIFFVTTFISVINSGDSIVEVFSALKIVYFLLYIIIGYSYGYKVNSSIKKYEKLYFVVLIVSILVSIIELFVPEISYLLYKRATLDILADKLTSLFNTTYHYAFFLFWGLCFYLSKLFHLIGERGAKSQFLYSFIISLAILFLILMTQSRNFILVSIILFSIKIISVIVRRIKNIKVTIGIFIVSLIGVALFEHFYTEIEARFSYVFLGISYLLTGGLDFSGGGSGSFNTRINQIIFAWNAISPNPLFGAGVGKDIYLESVYAYLLYKYGIIGLFTFFIMIFASSNLARKNELLANNLSDKVFFNSCFWFFSLSPIYFLSGPLFEVPKLSMFFYCLMGILVGYSRKLSNDRLRMTVSYY